MAHFEVVFLPAANADLEEIIEYIMVDNPLAAADMLDAIISSLRRLEMYPQSGSALLDRSLKHFQFRMVPVSPYIAFYRCVDSKVYIYRILHSARNYPHLLKGLT